LSKSSCRRKIKFNCSRRGELVADAWLSSEADYSSKICTAESILSFAVDGNAHP